MTTTLTILNGTLRYEPENGAPKSDIDLTGQQAVASIDHVGEPENPDPSTPSTPSDKSKSNSTGSTGDQKNKDQESDFTVRNDIQIDPNDWLSGQKNPNGASKGSTNAQKQN